MRTNPDIVGTYVRQGTREFYSCMRAELDRSGTRLVSILNTYNFAPHRFILVISTTPEVTQFAPFEFAVQLAGLYGVNADDSPFDAGRVEANSRQFDPVAMMGVSAHTLNGLRTLGHDPHKVFSGRTIWARPDAFDEVKAMSNVDARRIVPLGPMMAVECAHGGLHIDAREWAVEERDGSLLLSSRQLRFEPLQGFETGVLGTVQTAPCPCGIPDTCLCID